MYSSGDGRLGPLVKLAWFWHALNSKAKKLKCDHLDVMYQREVKWRNYEGQRSAQDLQQWSRLTQNGQKFESVLWQWKSLSMSVGE